MLGRSTTLEGKRISRVILEVRAANDLTQASVTQIMEAMVDGTTGFARYLLSVNADGVVTSIEGIAGAGLGTLKFGADVIQFVDPDDGTVLLEFDAVDRKLRTHRIVVDEVEAGSITGTGLLTGASGKAGAYFRDAEIGISDTSWTAIASTTIVPAYGKPIFIDFSCFARCTDDPSTPCLMRVVRDDGTILWGGSAAANQMRVEQEGETIAIRCFDGSVQGRSTSYTVEAKRLSSVEHVNVGHRSLIVVEQSRLEFDSFDVVAAAGEGPASGAAGGGGIGTYNPNQELPQLD